MEHGECTDERQRCNFYISLSENTLVCSMTFEKRLEGGDSVGVHSFRFLGKMSLSFLAPAIPPNPSSHHPYTVLFLPAAADGFSSFSLTLSNLHGVMEFPCSETCSCSPSPVT